MNINDRIKAFSQVGEKLASASPELTDTIRKATTLNPWFTQENITMAIEGIRQFLTADVLKKWTDHYSLNNLSPKTIGVAMAGNIPLVGFHDYLSILISGHSLKAKLSSQDSVLLQLINQWLIEAEPRFSTRISFEDRLTKVDAAIATGSDNTARYFEFYFKDIPHIIRKNRSSCAILLGEEPEEEFAKLGTDVFSYFGLGCRNVSKLFIPENYDFIPLLRTWESFNEIILHAKYANNYNYQRTILLMNTISFFDNGSIVLLENEKLVSPIAVVYYEKYKNQNDLGVKVNTYTDKLQCIVSAKGWYKGSLPFGKAQFPEVTDYADNVDTLKFLSSLN